MMADAVDGVDAVFPSAAGLVPARRVSKQRIDFSLPPPFIFRGICPPSGPMLRKIERGAVS
jgi:hypothetical protein